MIRESLKNYIETVIFNEYKKNELGHGINHIEYVIKRSLEFAKQIDNINIEMVYVVAAILNWSIKQIEGILPLSENNFNLYPEFPGKLTTAFWSIGREICHSTEPACLICPLYESCDQNLNITKNIK